MENGRELVGRGAARSIVEIVVGQTDRAKLHGMWCA